MISISCVWGFLFLHPDTVLYLCMMILLGSSIVGYVDDCIPGGLSEFTLGFTDLVLSVVAAFFILGPESNIVWFPFTSYTIELTPLQGILLFAPVIWICVNALNCNDGVDGLSGSLALVTVGALAFLLYFVVGNSVNAEYLLIPYKSAGSNWAIAALIISGSIIGYLWHNAPPSRLLMGDAGSRPIGLFIGMCITVTGNPFLIFIVCGLILANGATGLFKVALIRLFKIRLFSNTLFPLHDHMRRVLDWSGTQVLVRFILVHMVSSWILVLMLLKVR